MAEDQITVLIVEDEPLVRIVLADALLDAGFNVLEASNADEAIMFLEGRNDIRLVLTDVNMPGSMDGVRFAACIRDRWPPIKLIVTSGRGALSPAFLPAGSRFMMKPYSPIDVAKAVTEMTADID